MCCARFRQQQLIICNVIDQLHGACGSILVPDGILASSQPASRLRSRLKLSAFANYRPQVWLLSCEAYDSSGRCYIAPGSQRFDFECCRCCCFRVVASCVQAKRKRDRMGDLKIVVAGCVAQQEGQQLLRRVPEVDLVMGELLGGCCAAAAAAAAAWQCCVQLQLV
jgi:hypothetical protein